MDGIANHFVTKNGLRDFAIQSQNFPEGDISGSAQDQDIDFRLVRKRSHCSCFTKRLCRCPTWGNHCADTPGDWTRACLHVTGI